MISMLPARHSIKTRITLATLAIFVVGIWSLAFYTSRTLRVDMEKLLGEQQLSTVSMLAADANLELGDRMKWLESVAEKITPDMLENAALLQEFLAQRLILPRLFGGGGIIYRLDGTAIADSLPAAGRIGINYMDIDTVAIALKEGKPNIGRPVVGKKLELPLFGMTVPIRDAHGKVIGAFAGVINLGAPNFLDRIADNTYGKTGGYLLVAPQHRQIITATDKKRIMEVLPARGVSPQLDRFIDGAEATDVFVNPLGVEVLASAKRIPVADWYVASILPTSDAFAPIYAMQHRMLMAAIFMTLLAGGLTWWMLRRYLAPMLSTVETLARLSKSSQTPSPLPVTHHNEIGDLIEGFNDLLATIKTREDALRVSENRHRSYFNLPLMGFAVISPEKSWIDVNDRLCEIVGYTREELVTLTWAEITHPDDIEADVAQFNRVIEGVSEGYSLDKRFIRKDGGVIDVSLSVCCVRKPDRPND